MACINLKILACLGAVALLTLTVNDAEAQRSPTAKSITAQLESGEADTIQLGIENVGLSGSPRLIPILAARVRKGLPPRLLVSALDTFAAVGHASAGPILFELALHRRPSVRRSAVLAIAQCNPKGASQALVTALSDQDSEVRKNAALGLGQIGAKESVRTLFLALDKGITDAAISIGQLTGPRDVPRLLEYVGRIPFDSMTPALTELLARRDLPVKTRLSVVVKLEEVATPDAKSFLRDFVAQAGTETDVRIRRAAREAIERIVN